MASIGFAFLATACLFAALLASLLLAPLAIGLFRLVDRAAVKFWARWLP